MDSGFPNAVLSDELTGQLRRVAERRNLTAALPNAAYVDPGFDRAERDAIWRGGWIAIGFEADVPRKGSMMPVDVAGLPLLMVRDRAGGLRVFHNVCRHRGLKLVDRPGRTGSVIRCPYHAWCYRLDGALDRTPHAGGVGIDRHEAVVNDDLGLVEIRSAVWFGVVFADLSGAAPEIGDAFAEMSARWRDFGGAAFLGGGGDSTFELTVNCNWKLAVENYLESYHLPSIHPGLNSYSRIEDHELIHGGAGHAGQISLVYSPALDPENRGFPKVEGLSDYWRTRAEYIAVYPNLLYAIHADHWYGILLIPQGQERTLERVRIGYFTEEAAAGASFAGLREANTRLWRGVFEEDIDPVQRMQAGRHSPAFDGGVLTPVLEATTRDFHAWTAEKLLGA
ncbi:MAG: aromatic ring-hydroxylating oxygenase subunit alpha [Minwuia sp.]|uniref:aromatic ring-hydroxylating oxygenase subunit alpha n=1 Tax=Minwuia sp. TaxID=2493630 RepID=UPI003A875CBC